VASPQNPAVTRRRLSLLQGAYYLLSGAWPLVSMRSFEWVTGRKRDRWLVRTVGLLSMAFGVLLVRASHRGAADPGLGVAPAAAFGASSLWYRLRGVVNASYLLDAAAEAAFLAGWMRASRGSTEEPWSGGGPGD
jgi:uncharacterized membrane protein HdeD (DUF308 family)